MENAQSFVGNDNENLPEINKQIFDEPILNILAHVRKIDSPTFVQEYLDFEMGENTLQRKTKHICTSTHNVSAHIQRAQIDELKANFGIDFLSTIKPILIQEGRQQTLKEVMNLIDKFAEESYKRSWTPKEHKKKKRSDWIVKYLPFLFKWFPKIFKKFDRKECIIDGQNTLEVTRKLLSKILIHANLIAVNSRVGAGNVIIVNGQIASALQDMSGFVTTSLSLGCNGLAYCIGHIAGIKIIVDPFKRWDDLSVTILRGGNPDTPCFNVAYMDKGTDIYTIIESTMAPKIVVNTRYAAFFGGDDKNAPNFVQKIYFKFNTPLI